MIASLLRKELRQHWWAFALLGALAMLGYLAMLGGGEIKGTTPYECLGNFVWWIGFLGSLLLSQRLVAVEYRAKTQLFLESLPLARWHMLCVKYCLGLAVQGGIMLLAFALASLQTAHHGDLSVRFLIIVAARAFSVAWMLYSFFFLTGLLGRYRLAIGFVFLSACMAVAESSTLEFSRFGPFALIDQTFPFERELFPWAALQVTWALSLGFSALALVLSLTREGSVAAMLAEKMSYREKVFVAALLLAVGWASATLSAKVRKEPFDLQNASVEQRPGITVKVASGLRQDPDSERLAGVVVSELDQARDYLGLRRLPPVFISNRRDLDSDRFERGELERGEGVYLQAHFKSNQWQDRPFLAWLLPEVLTVLTDGRVQLESRRWVLDGFGWLWVTRQGTAGPLVDEKDLALRALYGVEGGFRPDDLRRWLTFRERVGPDVAAGVAWSGLRTLVHHGGMDGCRQWLRSALALDESKDFRVLLHPRRPEQAQLFAWWQAELADARGVLSAELARVPRVVADVRFVPLSAESRRAHIHVEVSPPDAARYTFLYEQLPAYDEEISPRYLLKLENSLDRREDDLPESFSRGSRLYWTAAVQVPALGCQVISGSRRQDIP